MKLPPFRADSDLATRTGWYSGRATATRGSSGPIECSPVCCLSVLEGPPTCPPCTCESGGLWLELGAQPSSPLSPSTAQWIMCARGPRRSLHIWRSANGASWTVLDVDRAEAATVIEPPACAVIQGWLYVALLQWLDDGHRRLVIERTADGVSWSSCTTPVDPSPAPLSALSLAFDGDRIWCAYVAAESLSLQLLAASDGLNFVAQGSVPSVSRVLPCPLPNGAGLAASGDTRALLVQDPLTLQLAFTRALDGGAWSSAVGVLDGSGRPLFVRGAPSAVVLDGALYVAANTSAVDWRWELGLLVSSSAMSPGAVEFTELPLPLALTEIDAPITSAPTLASDGRSLFLTFEHGYELGIFSSADAGQTWQDLSPTSDGQPIPMVTAPGLCWAPPPPKPIG